MKKAILGLIAIVFMSVSAFANNPSQMLMDIEKLMEETECINEKYISDTQGRTFKDWCAIGAADVGGAWAGAWAGGKIGGWFGPQGAAIGAVVGGVIVGGAASYGASRHMPPGTEQELIDTKIRNLDISKVYSNPNNNPYDISVGKRHNEILKQFVVTNPANGASTVSKIFENVNLTKDERIFYDNQQQIISNFYSKLKTSLSIETVKSLLIENIQDEALLTIMNKYLDGLNNCTTFENAIKITQDYETYVISHKGLSQEQKNVLLKGLAVARYSFNFWNKVY